jgi:hypothetical protein
VRFAHITLGKAGSQWIKDVLSDPDIFSLQKGLRLAPPPGGMYSIADFAHEPDGSFVAPIYHVKYSDWKTYAGKDDRCIAVLRDPRDSIVSWAFSTAYSHVTEEHIQVIRPTMLALDLRGKLEVAMYTFWESSAAQRSWAKQPKTKTEYVVTYESIIADQKKGFRAIMDFFGWQAPDGVLQTVIDRLSFKTRSGGRNPGEKQEFSHYRNGKAGDWKNYFDRGLSQRFEAACPGLLKDLGYEKDSGWWKKVPEHIAGLDEGAIGTKKDPKRLQAAVEALTQKNQLLEEVARERLEALERAVAIAERTLSR